MLRLAQVTVFGVPKSTIGRLIRNESELCKQLLEDKAQQIKSRKRKRYVKDAEVEEALNKWLRAVLAKSVIISCPMLRSLHAE